MLKLDSLREDIKKVANASEDVKAIWLHHINSETNEAFLSILVDDTKHVDTISVVEDAVQEVRKKYLDVVEVRPLKYLSTFLELVKHGDPKALSSLKEAVVFYDPANYARLLINLAKRGIVYELDDRAMKFLEKSFVNLDTIQATLRVNISREISQAVIESTQAVLMYAGKNPTNAEQFGDALHKLLGDKMKKEIALYNELYALDGEKLLLDIDGTLVKAKKLVNAMEEQLMRFEEAKD